MTTLPALTLDSLAAFCIADILASPDDDFRHAYIDFANRDIDYLINIHIDELTDDDTLLNFDFDTNRDAELLTSILNDDRFFDMLRSAYQTKISLTC